MRRRRVMSAGALAAAAALGSLTTIVLTGARPPAAQGLLPVSTTTVIRTNLVATQPASGTLGYSPSNPVVDQLSGTYTELPPTGTTIAPGGVLFRVDDRPVLLMAGAMPAWRSFELGMSDGPDVGELETDLISLGFARGLFTSPTDHFSVLTSTAVERWQWANGIAPSGVVEFGQLVFLPNSVVVGGETVSPGQPAAPGGMPFLATATSRSVVVPVGPDEPAATEGEQVSIVLPTAQTTPGVITAIGPPPPTTGSQGSSNGQTNGSGGSSQDTAVLTVTPADPAATGTGSGVPVEVDLPVQAAHDVLAVPISALLALEGGGDGLEVVEPSGAHRLTPVTTGVFTGTSVEVSGPGISAGTRVVVAQ